MPRPLLFQRRYLSRDDARDSPILSGRQTKCAKVSMVVAQSAESDAGARRPPLLRFQWQEIARILGCATLPLQMSLPLQVEVDFNSFSFDFEWIRSPCRQRRIVFRSNPVLRVSALSDRRMQSAVLCEEQWLSTHANAKPADWWCHAKIGESDGTRTRNLLRDSPRPKRSNRLA